jgi:hypothetical protein
MAQLSPSLFPITITYSSSVQTSDQSTYPEMGPKKDKTKDNSRNKNKKCVYFNRGYCRNGESCRDNHPDKVCPDPNCFEESCELRHPNPCKFGPRCHFNRKKICLYSHATLDNINSDKRFKEFEKRMHLLEKENETIGANFRDFTSKIEKKFETFEKKIDMLRNTLGEKERAILALEIRLNEREKSVDENSRNLNQK